MEVSLLRIILAGFPESLLLAYVSLGLVGVKTELKDYLKIGIVHTSGAIIIRGVLQLYGLHSLLLILLLVILLKLIVRLDLKLAVIGVLLAFIILFMIEAVVISILINYFEVDIAEIFNGDSFFNYLFSYSILLPLLIVALLIHFCDLKFNELANVDDS
ncbi:hypothetical protein MWH28_04600 [Natroniella sulfidigena]|uniref:hypothetical protein n=1 Tax=Natroniella sulfidigena TaxID=723921 RepID=UPI00200ADDED|nr:hypothetical protein [Natroniella sulfidigena]MCK8816650.1 hypothetical protein [Natroniella sulfidigena]